MLQRFNLKRVNKYLFHAPGRFVNCFDVVTSSGVKRAIPSLQMNMGTNLGFLSTYRNLQEEPAQPGAGQCVRPLIHNPRACRFLQLHFRRLLPLCGRVMGH